MTRPRKYAQRTNVNCMALAREIEIRPIVWDVKNISHHNRVALNECWNQIGNALNQPGEVCRKKWKYLKDQFRKELRMELRLGSKFRSTWKLYESLYYMKPHFKSLLSAHGNEGDYSNSSVGDCDESQTAFDIENDPVNEDYSHAENITVDVDPDYQYTSEDNDVDVEDLTQENDNDSAVILSERGEPPIKRIKLSRVESIDITSENSNDGSELFFQSLLPFMGQMSNIQKLRVRNTIQNVILHELEEGY